ncbi:hypothetical protein EV360DRAFT_66606 [Lentinula raphanica]|nr:hypothetical protein EV360DRAFT_66606 [Lentinula raphanica]
MLHNKWSVKQILSHRGSHSDAMFELEWDTGDRTWLPYSKIAHLRQLQDYLQTIGVLDITGLRDLSQTETDSEGIESLFIGLTFIDSLINEDPNPDSIITTPMANDNSLPADLAADLQSIDNEAQKLLNPSEPMDTSTGTTPQTTVNLTSSQPSAAVPVSPSPGDQNANGLALPPAFWMREIAGVSYANGIWTFISVEAGNRAFVDTDVLEFLYYSYARGRGWTATKPLFYDYFATHINSCLEPTTVSYWTLLDDAGKLFRAKKPVSYLCIWTRQELRQMRINWFKLRENASAFYPKPEKSSFVDRGNRSSGLSTEERRALANLLLRDERKGKGQQFGRKRKKNDKSVRGTEAKNNSKFQKDTPAFLGSFQCSLASTAGPSLSNDDTAMVE